MNSGSPEGLAARDTSDTAKAKHGDTMQYPMDFVGNKKA